MTERHLNTLLANLKVKRQEGTYVFTKMKKVTANVSRNAIMIFKEEEAMSLILRNSDADEIGISYECEFVWLTMDVFSSLQAVGFTAIISKVLAEANISANIVAAFHHDHIFVPNNMADQAIQLLNNVNNLSITDQND